MKILMMGTLTNSMNGSARSCVRLCNFLAPAHEVHVVMPDGEGVAKLLSPQVSSLIIAQLAPVRRALGAILLLPSSIFRMFRIVSRLRPDIVHINDIPWFYGVMVCKLLGVPVIMHSRYEEKNRLVKNFISLFLRVADAVIYVSDFNRKTWGLTKGQHYTLHNPGIFNFRFDASVDLPPRYALVVSRISPEKGIAESISLFSRLSCRDGEMHLVIAGDALYPYQQAYLEQCRALADTLGVADRIIWLGHVPSPHVLYSKAELYIHLPNFEDPFPTTMMEALALGCRIVTNGRGGILEQVTGFEGICRLEPDADIEVSALKLNDFMKVSDARYDRSARYHERFNEQKFYSGFEDILKAARKPLPERR